MPLLLSVSRDLYNCLLLFLVVYSFLSVQLSRMVLLMILISFLVTINYVNGDSYVKCVCHEKEKVLECGISNERGGVVLLVECRGAETLLARGYVTGFENQAVVEGFLDQVIIESTPLSCEALFDHIRTLRANLNRMDCPDPGPVLKTSKPRPPAFPAHDDNDDDDDDDDNDRHDDDDDDDSDDDNDDYDEYGSDELRNTSAVTTTTKTTSTTTSAFLIFEIKREVTIYKILLILSFSIVSIGGVWTIVIMIRSCRARRRNQPIQCDTITSTTAETTFVLREAPPRSQRRRKGGSFDTTSVTLFAVDEF